MKGTFDITKRFLYIEEIGKKYFVDSIKLNDIKIWNLIRILLFFYQSGRESTISFSRYLFLLIDGVRFNLFNKKIDICAFSNSERRKEMNNTLFDQYLDPLHDIIESDFYIFEWPSESGYRRKHKNIYTKNYIPIFIPVFSQLSLYILGKKYYKKHLEIENEEILTNVVNDYSNVLNCSVEHLLDYLYTSILIFYGLRKFFIKFLSKTKPNQVFIICGYGRVHMALNEACRFLDIPSIELQHGIISRHHAGYVKNDLAGGHDCVPEYLLTYGVEFSKFAKNGNLFDSKKIIDVGFPYIEERMQKTANPENEKLLEFISINDRNILISSQWAESQKIENFAKNLSKELLKKNKKIGLIFKPHPRDEKQYNFKNHSNVFLLNKFEDIYKIFKVIDIHSTAWSTTGIEALMFGKPNIFIELGGTKITNIIDIVDNICSFSVKTIDDYLNTLEKIIINYELISESSKKKSLLFFKPNAKKNIKEFVEGIK